MKRKICKECRELKPLNSGFHRSYRSVDGRMHICKDCFAKTISMAASRAPIIAGDEKKIKRIYDLDED